MQETTLSLWPTQILVRDHDIAATNALVLTTLDPERSFHPSHDRFDPRGWERNIFAEHRDCMGIATVQALMTVAACAYVARFLDSRRYGDRTMLIRGWWNGYRNGENIPAHHHSGVHLTATYYVTAPPPATPDPEEGHLLLLDPRGSHKTVDATGPNHAIAPKPGRLVVFPGYLLHETKPYHGRDLRIAISADILLLGSLDKYSRAGPP